MNIIVCIKQVPDTTDVKIHPETNTLIRDGVKSIVNPFDANALEAALQLKEAVGGKVTAITMGPSQAIDILREAVAMGIDDAVLLSDRAFAGADTLATAYTLAMGIRKIGDYDLIIGGKQAIDGDTAQVGPGIAEQLGIPQVTYAKHMKMDDGMLLVERMLEDGYEVIKTALPVLVTVVKQINEPRYPSLRGLLAAKKKEITVWNAADIGADEKRTGLAGSPTRVVRIFTPQRNTKAVMLEGEPEKAVETLAEVITKLNI